MHRADADYENGMLRLLQPLPLNKGERVQVIVLRRGDRERWDIARLSRGNTEETALASEGIADWADTLDREDAGEAR
jgi:predicted DNA-binding antitoxin AbrB/MazE fold protein